jgi:hypothetical protein
MHSLQDYQDDVIGAELTSESCKPLLQNSILWYDMSDWLFFGISLALLVDIAVRGLGLGFDVFLRNRWNLFDVIVVAGITGTTIPLLSPSEDNSVNYQLQKVGLNYAFLSLSSLTPISFQLFLTALCLKLIQRNDGLNQLFNTSV